jgi:hypothetical protein
LGCPKSRMDLTCGRTVGPLFCMPFRGGRTVGPHWGTNVTRTKSFWDPVSLGLNVWVELSLGPKMGG